MHTKAAGLSGGLKRRLKLALELLADRQILFLGESWATFSVKAPSARIEGKCFYKLAPLVDRCPWCPRVEYTLDFAVPVAPVRFAGFALVDVKSPRSAPTSPHTPSAACSVERRAYLRSGCPFFFGADGHNEAPLPQGIALSKSSAACYLPYAVTPPRMLSTISPRLSTKSMPCVLLYISGCHPCVVGGRSCW